jgi:exopolysaccharide production protein ExoQ
MATLFNRQWVRWAICWLLLCQIQAFSVIDRMFYGNWLGKPGNKFTQFINISQIIISIILFVTGSRRWASLQGSAILSLSLAAFLLCSAAWSVDAGATVRTGISYFFFILGLIGAAENVEADDFMDLLAWVCFLSAIASLGLIFISPSLADGGTGNLIGVFGYKGMLGQAMAIGGLACLHRLRTQKRSRLSSLFMLLVFTFVALKCRSTTSALVILLFYVIGAVIQLLQKGGAAKSLGVVMLTLLIFVVPVAAVSLDSLLELIGKDPTMTGRTDIWGYVVPYIYQRPLLGWGYAAFWSTLNPAAWEIANALRWYSPEAHNGLLEIFLSGGLVGAAWFLTLWVRTVRLSLRSMRYDSAMAITCLSCCAGILAEGVSEQVMLYVTGLNGVFFITGFFCEQAVSRGRQRRPVALSNVVRIQSAHVAPPLATVKFWPSEEQPDAVRRRRLSRFASTERPGG